MFSVRIVTTDHYLAPPVTGLDVAHSDFRGCDVKRVPVLRIFGATPAGQKTCMHVHGVFPYLYVPYDGTQPWERYLRLFATSLDKAINVANNNAKSNIQHVFKISIVSGIPMYGYHASEQEFLKIYLYNPSSIKKAADLLLGGAVMNKPFQPHEAHIPYNLQLFIDYNLYGMNLINVAAVKFRREAGHDNSKELPRDSATSPSRSDCSEIPQTPVLGITESPLSRSGTNTPSRRLWDAPNIPSELFLDPSVERQTTCELEVDVVAADILNRLEVDANVGTNPGLAAIWEDEKQRRRDHGESSQITPPESQDRGDIEVAESEDLLRQRLLEIINDQKPFHDSESDSESDMSQGSQDEYSATPASQVDRHLSQDEDELASSQDTVILEDKAGEGQEVLGEEPIISLESIQQVLSFSQSFSQSSQQSGDGDKTLADVLAAMVDESPTSSQLSASQVAVLEEQDSIIGSQGVSGVVDEDTLKEEQEETLEMSQRVWDGEEQEEDHDKSNPEEHNMEGMDDTWTESQWFSDEEKEEDVIPQFDGASDDKKDVPTTQRKRLGMTGHVMSHSHMDMQSSLGFPPYPGRSGYDNTLFNQSGLYRNSNIGHPQHPPPPFSPGTFRDFTPPMDYRLQDMSRVPRRNWEHDVWQQQHESPQQPQHLMSRGHIHQPYQGYPSSQQMHELQSGFPRNAHLPDRSYQGSYYNQYPHHFPPSLDSYHDQPSYQSQSPDFMRPSEQLSPNYMPNISTSVSHVPQSSPIAQRTMSLQSQHSPQITSQAQHMSPQTSQHASPIMSQSLMASHLSPHAMPSHRTPHTSPLSPQCSPYTSECMTTSQPVFPSPTREEASSFQKLLNSPIAQDSSLNRSLSRSSMHSSASHASNSSESELSHQRIGSDHRREDMMFDSMVNGTERSATLSMNDLPNMTSIELTSSECSTSVQRQLGDNSQDDLFGASPQTMLGSTPSLSVDESNESASESMIDMTGCDDFMPLGYDSGGSDRPGSQNSYIDEGPPHVPQFTNLDNPPMKVDGRRDSCPSSLSGLINFVSNVSNSGFRSRSKLSLKRANSDTGVGSGQNSHCWSFGDTYSEGNRQGQTIGMAPAYYPWGPNGDYSHVHKVVSNPKSLQNITVTKKRGRPPKKRVGLVVGPQKPSFIRKTPDASYTYAFHVPTPVYKRLKIRQTTLRYNNQVKIVRMHPMDARRYSLLKIGREVVPIPRLTAKDLQKFSRQHSSILSGTETFPSTTVSPRCDSNSDDVMSQTSAYSVGYPRAKERIPVLSQFSSYLNQTFEENDLMKMPQISPPKKRYESAKVRKLLKDKITGTCRTNLDIVQKPTLLQDILERKIHAVPNRNTTRGPVRRASEKPSLRTCTTEVSVDSSKGTESSQCCQHMDSETGPSQKEVQEMVTEKPVNEVQEMVTEEPVNEVQEVVTEKPVNEVQEMVTEEPVNEVQEVVTEEPVNEVQEVVTEEPVNEVQEVVTEEPVNKVQEVVTEEPVNEVQEVVTAEPVNEVDSDTVCKQFEENQCALAKKAEEKTNDALLEHSESHGCPPVPLQMEECDSDNIPKQTEEENNVCKQSKNSETVINCKQVEEPENISVLESDGQQQVLSEEDEFIKENSVIETKETSLKSCPSKDVPMEKPVEEPVQHTVPNKPDGISLYKPGTKETSSVPFRNFSETDSTDERLDPNKLKDQRAAVQNSSSDVESNRQFQMDFSSLEDPIVEQLPRKSSDVPDYHHLLHTPPLMLESDQEEKGQTGRLLNAGKKGKLDSVSESRVGTSDGSLELNVLDNGGAQTISSGFYSDKDPSSEVDSIFSVPHSRASSRASSRKESSDSSEGAVGRSKKLKKRKYSDGYDTCSSGYRNKRPSVSYSPKTLRHMMDEDSSKKCSRSLKRQRRRKNNDPFKNMKVGVHYIVVGRFKGYKSMQVRLKHPKLNGPSVNVHDYFAFHLEEKRLFDRAVHRDLKRPSSAESTSTISDYLMESRIVNCKSSESELSDVPLEFPSSRSSTPAMTLDEKTGELRSNFIPENSNSCAELCLSGYHCSTEPLATWLEESSALHSAQIPEPPVLPKASPENRNIESQVCDTDCMVKSKVEDIPASVTKSEATKTLSGLGDKDTLSTITEQPLASDPGLPSVHDAKTDPPDIPIQKDATHCPKPPAKYSECLSDNQNTRLSYCSSSSTQSCSQVYSTSLYVPSYKPKKTNADSSSSSDSSREPLHRHSYQANIKGHHKKSRVKSPYGLNMNLADKKGKRKNLTPNQRLGVAFLSTRHRRKKSGSGGKLMNSLFILHQATLANLTDSVSYTDGTDDYKTKYEDVMYKLALVSPPQSDKGETSPPVPLSPEDGDKDTPLKTQDKPKAKSETSPTDKHPPSSSVSFVLSTSAVATASAASAHVSMDSIYETPLSSVENNKDSKSPEISVLCTADSDSLPDILETNPTAVEMSVSECEMPSVVEPQTGERQSSLKDPIVCLTPLSKSDITRLTAELKKDNLSSPPNLGSPIFHPPNRRYSGSSSDASTICDSGRTPPPCLTPHRSPWVSDCSALDSHSESQHSWKSDKTRDVIKSDNPTNDQTLDSDGPSLQGCSSPTGEHSSAETRVSTPILTQNCLNDVASLSHDSSSNHSKASDTNTSTDSRKENCSGLEKQSNSNKLKGSEKTTKYSELKLSVRNLLTPRENAINASTLPAHYDMDCPVVIKTSQYEDISSDEDDEPGDATRRRSKRAMGPVAEKMEEKDKKDKENESKSGFYPRDHSGHSQGSSGGGSSGGSSLPSPEAYYGNVVLRPESCPPTKDMVCVSAHMYGLYTTTAQNAYCSNPDDLPDKPRELGGNAFRLETNRVKDLEEFESSAGTEGLRTWRTVFAADNQIFSSQSVEPLLEKLNKDPKFKFVLSEDKKITISPCHLPPKSVKVKDWLSARVARVKLKAQTETAADSVTDTVSKAEGEDEYVHFCELAAEITVEESKTDDDVSGVEMDESRDVSHVEVSPEPGNAIGVDMSVVEGDGPNSNEAQDVPGGEQSPEPGTAAGDGVSDVGAGGSQEDRSDNNNAKRPLDPAHTATGDIQVVDDTVQDIHISDSDCEHLAVSRAQTDQSVCDAGTVLGRDAPEVAPDSGTDVLHEQPCRHSGEGAEKDSEVCIQVVIETDSSEKKDSEKSDEDMDTKTNGCEKNTNCEHNIHTDSVNGEMTTKSTDMEEEHFEDDFNSKSDSSSPVQIVHLKKTVSDGGDLVKTDKSVKQIISPTSSKRSDKQKSRWDQKDSNPGPSKPSSTEPGECSQSPVHSTPVRRRSVDWFEPLCTPISTNQNKAVASSSSHDSSPFVTPRKPGPIRRLSSNTETSLRRSILASQLKSQLATPTPKRNTSQIDGPTPKNTYGFKLTQQNYQDAKALHEHQYLTAMSMEVLVETRGDLRPDPEVDAMQAIFYSIFNDIPPSKGERHLTGAIIVDVASARAAQRPVTPRAGPASPQPSTSAASPRAAAGPRHEPRPGTSKDKDIGGPGRSRNVSGTSDDKQQRCADSVLKKSGVEEVNTEYVSNEAELIDSFLKLIQKWDPDIVVGYEIQMLSWGYVLQRASHLGTDLCTKISRTPGSKSGNHASAAKDDWASDYTSEITIVGRIVINLWRLLRHEVTLNIYSFENVAFHVLHRRIPLYTTRTLSLWFNHRTHHHRWRVVDHYRMKVQGVLQIMEQLDLIGKTSEFARVFGIEFYHVLSRGSQYRVESMMLRLAKPMNFIPVSPSVEQRARQKAPECIPLNLEPESRFYPHPVVVVDFQSLYPSIMIAYNYCFSTCLGRLQGLANAHEGPFAFGCTSLQISPSMLKKLEKDVTISPNGIVFLKEHVRKGVLPRMVSEILNTRIMVKKAMKGYKNDKTLYRLLDARQLGLKLIANVTYGYTGASFSGRMPCIEVGDSIVRKARETLERAIKLVEDTPHWRARVVYGDTDSMFIHLEGRTKDEAFKIGQEIADSVTAMFPKPIKLKFEKVYMPCVLQTKKRYVGFSYETQDQKEPVYDAKGIETVRRDTCSAVAKILERCIKLLFTTRDVSQVKAFVLRQCHKFMQGKVTIQDCIFAKEFRGMMGYKPGACVPGLEIARMLVRQDRRAEPRVGERIPYVIVYGTPGMPLIQLVRPPGELLRDPTLRINGTYYITKQILPPLHRIFSLIGVDVFVWYQDMPKVIRAVPQAILSGDSKKGTISQYFSVSNCPVCDEQTKQTICARCMKDPQMVAVTLTDRIRHWDSVYDRLAQVCHSCMGVQDETQPCTSLDCPILFRRTVGKNDVSRGEHLRQCLEKALQF